MNRQTFALGTLLLAAAISALADAGDPPSRVARLNYFDGSVAFRPGSVEEWADATLNYPLTVADHLWTDPGAHAEMHIGSTALRMAPQTALAFLNLDDRTMQLSLTEGSLEVTVGELDPGDLFEIDTPNVAITLVRSGTYRVDVDSDRALTVVTARNGEADIAGGGDRFTLHAGEAARITGDNAESREVSAAQLPDDFERWTEDRDRRFETSESVKYTGADMTGYEDLDHYGVWREDADYGWVWSPRTAPADWAPYRYGHWAWIDPWGWTWIDDEPWGFAPFHYGRWVVSAGIWVWLPGRVMARPVYSPALVVFIGGGWGPGGGAAWFPLGPREPYRPPYFASDRYLQRMNVRQGNVTNIRITDIHYVNRTPMAVTAVPQDVFAGARPVNRGIIRIQDRDLARAEVIGTAVPIAPRRESVLAGPVRGVPSMRNAGRPVVVRTAPPPPPVNFQVQQRELERNQGRPLDPRTVDTLRPAGDARNPMVRTVLRPGDTPRDGWRPARQEAAPQTAVPAPNPQPRVAPSSGEPGRRFGFPDNRDSGRPQTPQRNVDTPRPARPAPTPAPRAEPQRQQQPARSAEPARSTERNVERHSERSAPADRGEHRQERKDDRKDK